MTPEQIDALIDTLHREQEQERIQRIWWRNVSWTRPYALTYDCEWILDPEPVRHTAIGYQLVPVPESCLDYFMVKDIMES